MHTLPETNIPRAMLVSRRVMSGLLMDFADQLIQLPRHHPSVVIAGFLFTINSTHSIHLCNITLHLVQTLHNNMTVPSTSNHTASTYDVLTSHILTTYNISCSQILQILGGGFNPFDNYMSQLGSFPQVRIQKNEYLEATI